MTQIKYRLLDAVDWTALNGQRVQIEVSDKFIIAVPLKAGGGFTIIAQAVKSRSKENGQPEDDGLPTAEQLMARETLDV